jgi:DNA repair exonuclease SbcCD ATPase subunit
MDAELRAYLEENRRHFDVVAEHMRSQLQLVAEGVSSLADRLDRLEKHLREEILRAQRELSAMVKFSYAELDRKIQGLETRYHELEERIRRLEHPRELLLGFQAGRDDGHLSRDPRALVGVRALVDGIESVVLA